MRQVPMRPERLRDASQPPEIEVVFGITSEELYAWMRVERLPDVWATQRLVETSPRNWRLSGRVHWSDWRGEKVEVPAKVMERPGIDSELHRIGPTIERLRESVASGCGGGALLSAIDLFDFDARSARGIRPASYADDQSKYRQRKRQGLIPSEGPLADDPLFLRLTAIDEGSSDWKALLAGRWRRRDN